MNAVLTMPNEQQKGASANFANFKPELAIQVGMEVSDDIGRVWASEKFSHQTKERKGQQSNVPVQVEGDCIERKLGYEVACRQADNLECHLGAMYTQVTRASCKAGV